MDRLMTEDDLAARWSVGVDIVRKILAEGQLRAIPFGKSKSLASPGPKVIRFRLADVEDYEASISRPMPGREALKARAEAEKRAAEVREIDVRGRRAFPGHDGKDRLGLGVPAKGKAR